MKFHQGNFEKYLNNKFTSTYIYLTICSLEPFIYLISFKRYDHSKNPDPNGGDCIPEMAKGAVFQNPLESKVFKKHIPYEIFEKLRKNFPA